MTFKQAFNMVHSSLIGARACNQIGTPWPNCRGISSLFSIAATQNSPTDVTIRGVCSKMNVMISITHIFETFSMFSFIILMTCGASLFCRRRLFVCSTILYPKYIKQANGTKPSNTMFTIPSTKNE